MGRLKDFAGETIVYGFANVFSRVFAMFLIPLYTNFLDKIEYSNLIMLQSLFTLLTFSLALNSGVFYYYYEYEKERYRKIVFSSWFYYQLTIATLIIFALWFASPNLKELFIITQKNEKNIMLALMLIGFQLLPYIINITNINLFRVDRSPKWVMLITFLESLFTLLFIGFGLLYYNFGIAEIFGAQIFARLLVAMIFIKKASFFLKIKNFSIKILKKLVHFSWPFFITSSFSWLILSVDKFVGVNSLSDQEDVAILSLAMQLTIPIVILADMIRMAIGPFIMSIRKERDADKSYQRIFDFSVFSSSMILIALVTATPLAVYILANESYMKVINVVPLIAFASILSLMYNQLAIAFSLSKKNVYIMYATVLGGLLGFLINKLYMPEFGYMVSGISQIFAYSTMVAILYFLGKKLTDSKLKLTPSLWSISIIFLFFLMLFLTKDQIQNGQYMYLILFGITSLVLLSILFFLQQKLNPKEFWKHLIK